MLSADLLGRHVKRVHTGHKYQCELCSYTTRCQRSYTTHVRAMHEGLKFSCVCSYQTGFFSNLIKHRKLCREYKRQLEIGALDKESSQGANEKGKNIGVKGHFSCTACGYSSTIRGHLINHQRFCKGVKPKQTKRSRPGVIKSVERLQNLEPVVAMVEGPNVNSAVPDGLVGNQPCAVTDTVLLQQTPNTLPYFYDPMSPLPFQ